MKFGIVWVSCWASWTGLTKLALGTPEREVKARSVHRTPAGQRGDARYAKSIRGVPWQPNPAEVAEGEPVSIARIVSVPMVPIKHRPVVPVVEPREYRARRFYIQREVEVVKFGYSENCDGCNAAQLGTKAKPHSEGFRERIRQAMMNDDMGQQRLQEAEQRRAATEGHLTSPRVEAAQEGQDVEMTATHAAGNAESSESQPVETSSRMEDVAVSRKNVERRKWVLRMTGHVRQRRFSCHWVWFR